MPYVPEWPRAPAKAGREVGVTPGKLIRQARIEAGLSQGQLAARAGTAQSAISRIENDRISPTVETLERIIVATGAKLEMRIVRREA